LIAVHRGESRQWEKLRGRVVAQGVCVVRAQTLERALPIEELIGRQSILLHDARNAACIAAPEVNHDQRVPAHRFISGQVPAREQQRFCFVELTAHLVQRGHERHRPQQQRLGAHRALGVRGGLGRATHVHQEQRIEQIRVVVVRTGDLDGSSQAAFGLLPLAILHGDHARTAQRLRRIGRELEARSTAREMRCCNSTGVSGSADGKSVE
jgi:hypothetical protein